MAIIDSSVPAELAIRIRRPGRSFGGVAAAFLDRDGVINNNGRYVNTVEDFELIPGAADAVRRLNEADIPVIVVTNQGSVALEYLTRDELERIHDKMEQLLADHGACADAVYAALAYPEGTIPELTKVSKYRKPDVGMIDRARDELDVDPARSYVVGDATSDILMGNRAGCFTILVETGFAGEDGKAEATPDIVVADLPAAVDLILSRERQDA
jgi:histidinol-phosphate phosphatase family protein